MLATTGVLVLGTLSAPAAYAAGVDESELAQLRADIAATSTAWRGSGGTDTTRCTMSLGSVSLSSRTTVEFGGGAGAVHLRYGSSAAVTAGARALGAASAPGLLAAATRAPAGGIGPMQAYLTTHVAITPLPGQVRTALERHGLRTDREWVAQPYGSTGDPSLSRAAYRSATRLDSSLVSVAAFGRVTALTSTSDATSTTYRGTAVDPSAHGQVDPLDFTVVVSGGVVTRVVVSTPRAADDELGMGCRSRLTLGGTSVHPPRALTRHPEVVGAEMSLMALSSQVAGTASLLPRDQRARVRMVQALAWTLARPGTKGPHVTVAEVANGVALTRKVRGWSHPLRWQVTVRNGHVQAYPVVTTHGPRHR